MRRAVLPPLTFGLAVLTAVTLLGAAYAAPGGAAEPDPSRANAATVWRFYDAANTALRTGDAADLEWLLAPGFVEHAARAGLPSTGAGLVRYLGGLRASFPALRLTAGDVIAQGDRVAARVRVEGVDEREFMGLPVVDGTAPWGALDAFRVEEGRIVEHWGGHDVPVVLEPLLRVPLGGEVPRAAGLELAPTATVRMRRLTLAPGEEVEAPPELDALLHVEAGSLVAWAGVSLEVVRAASGSDDERTETVVPAAEANLGPGDAVIVPAGSAYGLRNAGEGPAVALVTTVAMRLFPDAAPATRSGDASAPVTRGSAAHGKTLVEASWTVPLPDGRTEVAVGRATLASGASLTTGGTIGPALVAVEHGALTAVVDGREIERGAGAGMALPSERTAVLRNAGPVPLSLLVLTVGVSPEASTGAAG